MMYTYDTEGQRVVLFPGEKKVCVYKLREVTTPPSRRHSALTGLCDVETALGLGLVGLQTPRLFSQITPLLLLRLLF